MRPQIHVTEVRTYLECGERFRRRRVESGQRASSVVQIVGIAVDEAVTSDLQNKINHGHLLASDKITTIARRSVKRQFKDGVALTKTDNKVSFQHVQEKAIDKAVALAMLHHRHVAPKIKPTAVQHSFSISLDDFLISHGLSYSLDLVGTMDVLEANKIRDTKTTATTPDENCATDSVQLTGYALAYQTEFGKLPGSVVLDYLVHKRTPYVVTHKSKRTLEDCGEFLDWVARLVGDTINDSFSANPSWRCRMCPYREDCEFNHK